MRVSVLVCDLDPEGASRSASTWTITGPEGKRSLDLCEEHSAPLRALLEASKGDSTTKKTTSAPRKRAANRSRVVTLEEIEASKKK